MTNTSTNDNQELTVEAPDPSAIKCTRCVWGYVLGHYPTDMSCGKFKRKLKSVYFQGKECPRFEELKKLD